MTPIGWVLLIVGVVAWAIASERLQESRTDRLIEAIEETNEALETIQVTLKSINAEFQGRS